jgi:hypothetical protein
VVALNRAIAIGECDGAHQTRIATAVDEPYSCVGYRFSEECGCPEQDRIVTVTYSTEDAGRAEVGGRARDVLDIEKSFFDRMQSVNLEVHLLVRDRLGLSSIRSAHVQSA